MYKNFKKLDKNTDKGVIDMIKVVNQIEYNKLKISQENADRFQIS